MFTEEEKFVLQSYGHQDKKSILASLQKDMEAADEPSLEFLTDLFQTFALASLDQIKEALKS